VEDYAHTALLEMLTSAAGGSDLAGALEPLAGRRRVLDALIDGLGPVVSTLLQVTLGLGGRAEAGTVSLGQAEEELRTSGRDLMRATLQAVVDAACAAQERVPGGVDGPDGVRRTRVEDGHARTVATVFGRITVDRLAYRAAGASNVHPLDEVLDLPDGLYSTGLARLSAREAVRGSFGEAGDAVEYVTGVRIGTRQLIGLTRAAADDAADYYTARQAPPADPGDALVITADGKGIPVRPEALRAGTAKLAAKAKQAPPGATSGNAGGRGNSKRMAVMRNSSLRPTASGPSPAVGHDPGTARPRPPTPPPPSSPSSVTPPQPGPPTRPRRNPATRPRPPTADAAAARPDEAGSPRTSPPPPAHQSP
jgi:hypothetical protein